MNLNKKIFCNFQISFLIMFRIVIFELNKTQNKRDKYCVIFVVVVKKINLFCFIFAVKIYINTMVDCSYYRKMFPK